MKKITTRGLALGDLSEAEQRLFRAWAWEARRRTTFDLGIFAYPRCGMLIADKDEEPLAFLPVQAVLSAECFIPRPDATTREKVMSLWRFDEALQDIAKALAIGDVSITVPVQEAAYAEQLQRNGWVETPGVRVFRKSTGVTIQAIPKPSVEVEDK